MNIQSLLTKVERISERKLEYENQLRSLKGQRTLSKRRSRAVLEARNILDLVALQTQKNFKTQVEKTATRAVKSVWPHRKYKFRFLFGTHGGKTTIQPVIKDRRPKGLMRALQPSYDMGIGMLDVLSLVLRIVFWTMENPRSRNVFILDEPFRNIGKGLLLKRCCSLVRELADSFDIQLIITTHEPTIAEIADRVWRFDYDGKRTIPKLLR